MTWSDPTNVLNKPGVAIIITIVQLFHSMHLDSAKLVLSAHQVLILSVRMACHVCLIEINNTHHISY